MDKVIHEGQVALPDIKWQIEKQGEAEQLKLKVLDVNESKSLLVISLQDIPRNMSIEEFMTHIIESGIVIRKSNNK